MMTVAFREMPMTAAQTRRSTGGPRLFGIEIRVRFSWLIIAVLAAWSLAAGSFPEIYQGLPASAYWTMAILVVVGLAVSIILHELGTVWSGAPSASRSTGSPSFSSAAPPNCARSRQRRGPSC